MSKYLLTPHKTRNISFLRRCLRASHSHKSMLHVPREALGGFGAAALNSGSSAFRTHAALLSRRALANKHVVRVRSSTTSTIVIFVLCPPQAPQRYPCRKSAAQFPGAPPAAAIVEQELLALGERPAAGRPQQAHEEPSVVCGAAVGQPGGCCGRPRPALIFHLRHAPPSHLLA